MLSVRKDEHWVNAYRVIDGWALPFRPAQLSVMQHILANLSIEIALEVL